CDHSCLRRLLVREPDDLPAFPSCRDAGAQGFKVAQVVAPGDIGRLPAADLHHVLDRAAGSGKVRRGGVPRAVPHEATALPPDDEPGRLACLLEGDAQVAEAGVAGRPFADTSGRTVPTVKEVRTPGPCVIHRSLHDGEPFTFQRKYMRLAPLA